MNNKEKPQVGLAIIVRKDRKILFGLRKGSHGKGTWSFPGGKLDHEEGLKESALRELREETGIDIKLIDENPCAVTNDIFETGEHYVTLYFRADYKSGEPQVLEPKKCERWEWHSWHNLPEPLFLPVQNLINQGYNPFEW